MKLNDLFKSDKFEAIWVAENAQDYSKVSLLNDKEFIEYKIWEGINWKELYRKHLPHVTLIRGKNVNIIFHGRCLGCLSQRLHGIDRCVGCRYFRGKWNKPNLYIEGETDKGTLTNADIIGPNI